MIENRVRELVADIQSAAEWWTPAERIDGIAELESAVAMLQGLSNVEAVAIVEKRRAADRVAGVGVGMVGRGAPRWRSRWPAGCPAQPWTTSSRSRVSSSTITRPCWPPAWTGRCPSRRRSTSSRRPSR